MKNPFTPKNMVYINFQDPGYTGVSDKRIGENNTYYNPTDERRYFGLIKKVGSNFSACKCNDDHKNQMWNVCDFHGHSHPVLNVRYKDQF